MTWYNVIILLRKRELAALLIKSFYLLFLRGDSAVIIALFAAATIVCGSSVFCPGLVSCLVSKSSC